MTSIFFWFLFFLNVNLFADHYVVSEVFGKKTRSSQNSGQEWIEIANLSKPIVVRSVTLEIFIKGSKSPDFKKRVNLLKPKKFVDYLLIAQKKNLGLTHCLSYEPFVVVFPELFVASSEDRKFCVAINDNAKTCASLSHKVKTLEGISLFRDLSDLNEEPLWRYEPCHFVDSVFFSPGIGDRFCRETRKEHLFRRCDYLRELKVTTRKAAPLDLLPLVSRTLKVKENDDGLLVTVDKLLHNKSLVAGLCARPEASKKICHLVDGEQILIPTAEHYFSSTSLIKNMGDQLYIYLSDFLGNTGERESESRIYPLTEQVESESQFQITAQDQNQFLLKLELKADEVPINILISSSGGDILLQKSFVEFGVKNIIIPAVKGDAKFVIDLIGPKGNKTFPVARAALAL